MNLSADEIIIMAFGGAGAGLFTWLGFNLFSEGWSTTEEKYISDAERDMESMFLAIPPQQLFYLAFLVAGSLFAYVQFAMGNTLIAVLAGVIGFFVPAGTLYMMKRRRQKKFEEQLVDMLQSMTNSLKAGFSLPNSFEIIRKEMEPPMSQEVGIMVQEMRLGTEMVETLDHLEERMPCDDMSLIKTAIAISSEMGGNLNVVLASISTTIRERMRLQGKIDSLTAQGKIQSLVMSSLPGAFLVAVSYMTPGYLDPMWVTWTGWFLLFVAAVLNILAMLWIRKIVNIEF
ncbi:type II secretion system F family protein [bacterium AH-315-F18]|nr:type II secretion system F family protein [bacterium AH-315-F18]